MKQRDVNRLFENTLTELDKVKDALLAVQEILELIRDKSPQQIEDITWGISRFNRADDCLLDSGESLRRWKYERGQEGIR